MRIFSFDAETNGLWGKAFAIAAIVFDENSKAIALFKGRCPITGEVNEWVKDNVLPQIEDLDVTYGSYELLLEAFSKFYLEFKADSAIIAHMPFPVETTVLRDMRDLGYIGDWDGPFPLIDVSGLLLSRGEDATSVDAYCKKYDLKMMAYSPHHPLYDSHAAAAVYRHILKECVDASATDA
jgi:hypothetical protein